LFLTESLYTEMFLPDPSEILITGGWLATVLTGRANALIEVRGKGVEFVKGIGFYSGIYDEICIPLKLKTGTPVDCYPPSAYPELLNATNPYFS
jgi:hypothetical protein